MFLNKKVKLLPYFSKQIYSSSSSRILQDFWECLPELKIETKRIPKNGGLHDKSQAGEFATFNAHSSQLKNVVIVLSLLFVC